MRSPRRGAGFCEDPARCVVLVVDVQRMFASFPLHPPAAEVLPRLAVFLSAARTAGVQIVRIQLVIPIEAYSDNWRRQFPTLDPTWLVPGTSNVEFEPGFEPEPGDIVITKHRFGAFYGTTLDSVLRSHGIRTVVMTGLTTAVCVGTTAREAFQHDYAVVMLSDCMAEGSQRFHEVELDVFAENFGIVLRSDKLLERWQRWPAPTVHGGSLRLPA